MKTMVIVGLFALVSSSTRAASKVSFSPPAQTVEAYDFVEVTVRVDKPEAGNPFLDATVTGSFSKADGTDRKSVEGFCDSADGSVFRIRFMPALPGDYTYSVPKEGTITVKLEPGAYEAAWFSAFTGEKIPLPPIHGPEWTSPKSPGWLDWAILIQKQK